MARLRLRVSLLNLLLVTVIVALAVVVIRQQRELEMIRQDARYSHRFWKSGLQIVDSSKLHAIQLVDIQSLLWTWRIWVPRDADVVVKFRWGDIPAKGYPSDARSIELPPGDNWLALKFNQLPRGDESIGQLFGPDSVVAFVVPSDEQLAPYWRPEYRTDVLSARTYRESVDGRLLLERFRVADDSAMEDVASKGFIIWLERR